jgi:uncharacterized membrane protein (DUF441 family)
MGIRFTDSILVLIAAACGVFTAYFVGHGLSTMTAWPWITAGVLLLAALLLGAFTIRRIRRYAAEQRPPAGH